MIRAARCEDAQAIAELEVRAWRWAYADIVGELDLPTVAERLAHWRDGPLDGVGVWDQGGMVVGVVDAARGMEEDPAVGCLRTLYVDPAAQGAGVGSALHDHAVATLREAGCSVATLWTFTAHGQAREFFAKRGWMPDGVTGESHGAPSLRYRREL